MPSLNLGEIYSTMTLGLQVPQSRDEGPMGGAPYLGLKQGVG